MSEYYKLNEDQYQKFVYCKEKLKGAIDIISINRHGYKINYLKYNYTPINDHDADVLKKYAKGYQTIYNLFIERVRWYLQYNDVKKFDDISFDKFKELIDVYIEENDKDGMTYY